MSNKPKRSKTGQPSIQDRHAAMQQQQMQQLSLEAQAHQATLAINARLTCLQIAAEETNTNDPEKIVKRAQHFYDWVMAKGQFSPPTIKAKGITSTISEQ